jgi:hypothetical protein
MTTSPLHPELAQRRLEHLLADVRDLLVGFSRLGYEVEAQCLYRAAEAVKAASLAAGTRFGRADDEAERAPRFGERIFREALQAVEHRARVAGGAA